MRLPDLRYILVKRSNVKQEEGSEIVGFSSFMLTYEDGYEVIYCYEIHLAPDLQGKGIGRQLIDILEDIGKTAGVQKSMLTVLMANELARNFYEKLGYAEDEYSPGPRKMRNGIVKQPDYAILSKLLRDKIRRPNHVKNKRRKVG